MSEISAGFDEGYEEGKLIAQIDVAIKLVAANEDKLLEELIQEGTLTEYQRQQALLYIRLGIK